MCARRQHAEIIERARKRFLLFFCFLSLKLVSFCSLDFPCLSLGACGFILYSAVKVGSIGTSRARIRSCALFASCTCPTAPTAAVRGRAAARIVVEGAFDSSSFSEYGPQTAFFARVSRESLRTRSYVADGRACCLLAAERAGGAGKDECRQVGTLSQQPTNQPGIAFSNNQPTKESSL